VDAEERGLARGTHRPRVEHVVAQVAAAVDARDDERRPARQQLHDREVHAVRRRAVHGEDACVDLLRPQRVLERQRLGARARLAVGRDQPDLAHALEGRRERADPRGVDTVVVRDEDEWVAHGS
jgi:hypothetical protein